MKLSEGTGHEEQFKKFAHDRYIGRVTVLVAVLSVTGDNAQAKKMYEKALEEMDTVELRESLDRALTGEVPQLRA